MQKVITYIKKVKPVNPLTLFKKWLLTDLIVDAERLDHRVDRLENQTSIDDVERRVEDLEYYDLHDIQERAENTESLSEENENKLGELSDNIIDIEGDIKTIKGNINALTTAHNMVEELNKETRTKKQPEKERSEENLSAMQKLSFEICKYYGGDFNLDDFNNCYDIIKKYDVKEVK